MYLKYIHFVGVGSSVDDVWSIKFDNVKIGFKSFSFLYSVSMNGMESLKKKSEPVVKPLLMIGSLNLFLKFVSIYSWQRSSFS